MIGENNPRRQVGRPESTPRDMRICESSIECYPDGQARIRTSTRSAPIQLVLVPNCTIQFDMFIRK
jgi:hypothetical protein